MAIDRRNIYYNAVLGACGGLCGWVAVRLIDGVLPGTTNVYVKDFFIGLLAGACIGAAIGSTDGLVVSRTRRRLIDGVRYGAILGAVGGAVGGILAELLLTYSESLGRILPRALAWGIFGALVGSSDGFAAKMPARIRYGVIGGLLGGVIGGATYEWLMQALKAWGGMSAGAANGWGSALGLIIVGACIGALIGLVESLLRTAWLRFINGRFEGQSRTLDPGGGATTIGSSDLCHVVLFGDASALAVHAQIVPDGGKYVIQSRDGAVSVDRNGVLPAASSYPLQSGDRVQVGATRFTFLSEDAK